MKNIVLTGFMGTGKTSVGQEVAWRLGWSFLDMDAELAARAGKSISRIFAEEGEAAFRRMERLLCRELASEERLVIATGGGTLLDHENRRLLLESGLVICLYATVEELLCRLQQAQDRPLLQVADRRRRIEELLAQRSRVYDSLPHRLDTTGLTIPEVADRVIALWTRQQNRTEMTVRHQTGSYHVLLAEGLLCCLGELLLEAGLDGPTVVVSNPVVWDLHGATVERALKRALPSPFTVCLVPDGEEHKTLKTVMDLYGRFLAAGLDRGGTVLALGGGVIGDLAGFAAATYMRGVAFVPVPTTLLAMVDAAVGGKVAVDLPQGKNLVGAFKQPALVIMDPLVLHTLPDDELRCGLAEVVKAAVIGDPALFAFLEQSTDPLAPDSLPYLVHRALAVKAAVVEEDPLEQGRRAVLNLGHTVGHALERLSGYRLRHGYAVSSGMVVAARLSQRLGLCSRKVSARLEAVLRRLGLPVYLPAYATQDIWEAMQADKKRRRQTLRWVLPLDIGKVEVRGDVPKGMVWEVLRELGAGPGAVGLPPCSVARYEREMFIVSHAAPGGSYD